MKFAFQLLFLMIFFPSYIWAQKDFKSNEWITIHGKENHHNPQDFSGSAKINSTGEKLVMEVDITDNNIILNDNYLNSDRLELWLSSNKTPSEYTYSVIKDSTTKFNPGYRFYTKVPDAKNSVQVAFGTVHYAILPSKERKVLLLNREHYDWLEKSTGEKPGHIEQGITIKTELTKTGYKLIISLSPLALGFVQLPAMKEIKFKLHAIDIDSDKSSSVESITGPEDEFQPIQFSKELHTNVTSISSYIFDSLSFHPTLMFNSKGFWSGITMAQHSDGQNKMVAFIRSPLGSRKWKENNVEIEKMSLNSFHFQKEDTSFELIGKIQEFYFSKSKVVNSSRPVPNEEWQFKGLQKEFTFLDSYPGLLLIKFNSDSTCQNYNLKTLTIAKLKQDKIIELLNIIEDPCKKNTSIGSLSIPDFKIEKIYWQKEGILLMIEGRVLAKGEMKFRISFQGDKAIVTPVKK